MGLFANSTPPALPIADAAYSATNINQLLGVLRTYFLRMNAVQPINVAQLNCNIDTLPTEADIATLRSGDIYRDSTASNVLKIKV